MVEIYLIRHGQASFGQPAYDRLSSLGEQQAALLGRHLSKNGIRFDAVYSGALRRHVQTANIVLEQMNEQKNTNVTIDADFNEVDSSDQMMNRLCEVIREDSSISDQMRAIHTHPGAISRIFDIAEKADMLPEDKAIRKQRAREFKVRIAAALDNLVQAVGCEKKKVAVFTSGGPIAVALGLTLETKREQTHRLGWELRNTSVTILRHDQDRFGLVLFNCVAHLETLRDPALITYI